MHILRIAYYFCVLQRIRGKTLEAGGKTHLAETFRSAAKTRIETAEVLASFLSVLVGGYGWRAWRQHCDRHGQITISTGSRSPGIIAKMAMS